MDKVFLLFVWIKTKFLAFLTKVCKMIKKTIIYENREGIKEINPVFPQNKVLNFYEKSLKAEELYLGIDFLNDKYTLIDTPIINSPHYMLMLALANKQAIRHTDYVKRMLRGTLDERYSIIAYYLNRNYFRACYERASLGINTMGYDVVVYEMNGRYYIHDGKHRAALCALRGIDIKCKVIEYQTVCSDFNTQKIKTVMYSSKYLKHKRIFENMHVNT